MKKNNSVLAKPLATSTHICLTVSQLFEPQLQKSSFLRTPAFIFLFALGTPLWQSRKTLHEWKKTIQCLPNPSQHLPIYVQQFPSYSNHNCKNRHFYVPRPSFFCLPWGRPAAITQNVAWMKKNNSVLAKPLATFTHICSTVSQLFEPQVQKIAVFTYRSPHFCFPLKTPLRLSRNMFHGWKDNSMLAKPLAACTFNSFRVIRCLSQCVSPKIAIFTTFWFPLGTPLG